MIAKSQGDRTSQFWNTTVDWLRFPEAQELCLGYTSQDTRGSGSSKFIARQIASAIWKAIHYGRSGLKHFEEVQLFEGGIGKDRISDATACILRDRFARYTERVCRALSVPTLPIQFDRSHFDPKKCRWVAGQFRLPKNPYNNKSVLLCPKRFLRGQPSINSDGFWEYCYDQENELLRREFGNDITRHVDKKKILELADRHPELEEEYVTFRERSGSEAYDLADDPRSFYKWYETTRAWSVTHPLDLRIKRKDDFYDCVQKIIGEFSNFVSNNAGWKLLWNDNGTPKREEASQVAFLGAVKHYCMANNIDVSKEANIGRGPVDFKVSQGHMSRMLIEIKLARNTRFWNGLEKQLPKYLEAEGVEHGIFLVVCYDQADLDRVRSIRARIRRLSKEVPYRIREVIVDARRNPTSASLL